jgi:hypothetical protein
MAAAVEAYYVPMKDVWELIEKAKKLKQEATDIAQQAIRTAFRRASAVTEEVDYYGPPSEDLAHVMDLAAWKWYTVHDVAEAAGRVMTGTDEERQYAEESSRLAWYHAMVWQRRAIELWRKV